MNTLKNAALLVVMGGVLYFVYVTTAKKPHQPANPLSYQHESMSPPDIQIGPAAGETPAPIPAPAPLLSQAPAPSQLPPPPAVLPGPLPGLDAAPPLPQPVIPPVPVAEAPPAAVEVPPEIQTPPATAIAETPPANRRSVYEVATADPATTPAQPQPPEVQNVTAVTPANSAPPAAPSRSLGEFALQQDFQAAQQLAQAGRFRDALAKLSPHAKEYEFSKADRETLYRWLDALAAKVIYSGEHHLAEPYTARSSETLITISNQYKVPWQLLQNINGIRDPQVLVNGTVLKVVPGPFRAEIDMSRNQCTLYLNDLYAGRFACTIGDEPPAEGVHSIKDKSRERVYFGRDARNIPHTDPSNPYGGWWLDLGGTACLHGSPTAGRTTGLGCVSFSPQDARDLYGILSVGSQVAIRK